MEQAGPLHGACESLSPWDQPPPGQRAQAGDVCPLAEKGNMADVLGFSLYSCSCTVFQYAGVSASFNPFLALLRSDLATAIPVRDSRLPLAKTGKGSRARTQSMA